MILSNSAMNQAAADIRAIASAMTSSMNELQHPATWSGNDADKFARDWNDLVYSRLTNAANKLDGVSFHELIAGFNG